MDTTRLVILEIIIVCIILLVIVLLRRQAATDTKQDASIDEQASDQTQLSYQLSVQQAEINALKQQVAELQQVEIAYGTIAADVNNVTGIQEFPMTGDAVGFGTWTNDGFVINSPGTYDVSFYQLSVVFSGLTYTDSFIDMVPASGDIITAYARDLAVVNNASAWNHAHTKFTLTQAQLPAVVGFGADTNSPDASYSVANSRATIQRL